MPKEIENKIKGNGITDIVVKPFVPDELYRIVLHYTGVHESSEKFVSRCSIGKHVEYLGSFDCQIKAFNIYKLRKESYAKELAKKYKENIHNEVFFYIDGLLSEYR